MSTFKGDRDLMSTATQDRMPSGSAPVPNDRANELIVLEKATGGTLATLSFIDLDILNAAAESARAALGSWSSLPYTERCALLLSLAQCLEARADSLTELIMRETGSIRGKAEYEVAGAIQEIHAAIAIARRPRGEVLNSASPGRYSTSIRQPVGVVAVLTPWNFPLILAIRALAPALALGNVVLLKPSPETPLSGGIEIAEMVELAGFPVGVVQVLVADLEESRALIAHPEVDMVHFTGSTAVGAEIAKTTGALLKRVSLELGGNNALVVLDDVDLEIATSIGAWSTFHYQGQTCISASRHIVHNSIVEQYTAQIAERARNIVVGDTMTDGTNFGPMINTRQRDRAARLLKESVEMGAVIVEGGTYDGLFFRPTVVTGVTPDMPLFAEEVFGPIVPITSFSTIDEAVSLVNDGGYGLANSILTADATRGSEIASRIRSGMVHVNDATCIDEAAAPFGGIGQSGLGGRSGGEANYDEFTERKWLTVNHDRPEYPY